MDDLKRYRSEGLFVEFSPSANKQKIEQTLGKLSKRRGVVEIDDKMYAFNYYFKLPDGTEKVYSRPQIYFRGRKSDLLKKYAKWVEDSAKKALDEDLAESESEKAKELKKLSSRTILRNFYKSKNFRNQLAQAYENSTYNSTIEYLQRVEKTNPTFFSKQLSEIELADVSRLFSSLKNVRTKKPLSVMTKKRLKCCLVKTFEIAKNNGLIEENIIQQYQVIGKKSQTSAKDKKNILNHAEKELVLKEISRLSPLYQHVIRFVLLTGLRNGEVHAVEWSDVDWENNRINIHQSMTVQRGNLVPILKNYTKTGEDELKPRRIPLYPKLRELLIEHKAFQDEKYKQNKVNRKKLRHDYIFAKEDGASYNIERFSKEWAKFRNKLIDEEKLTKLTTFHNLRGTYITECLRDGMKAEQVKEIVGHSNISITIDYYTLIDDSDVSDLALNFYK